MTDQRSTLGLFVSVPIAGFRAGYAREYLETYPLPPPSTVYGMLLSLIGEEDRLRHRGSELALIRLGRPGRSRVLRTAWRFKDARGLPGLGENKRPDWQELLTEVRLAVFVRPGSEEPRPSLAERVGGAMSDWTTVSRFGGLSLGESSHLVDEVRPVREMDLAWDAHALLRDPQGSLSLPVWPDHVGSSRTRWESFTLETLSERHVPDQAWVAIEA